MASPHLGSHNKQNRKGIFRTALRMQKNGQPMKSFRELIFWELGSGGSGGCLGGSEEESPSPMARSMRGKIRYLASKKTAPSTK
jgi:hypothetical protein